MSIGDDSGKRGLIASGTITCCTRVYVQESTLVHHFLGMRYDELGRAQRSWQVVNVISLTLSMAKQSMKHSSGILAAPPFNHAFQAQKRV